MFCADCRYLLTPRPHPDTGPPYPTCPFRRAVPYSYPPHALVLRAHCRPCHIPRLLRPRFRPRPPTGCSWSVGTL